MNRKIKKILTFMVILCMLMVFIPITHSVQGEDVGTLGVENFSATLNDSAITEDTVVKNGDKLVIDFDWNIPDSATSRIYTFNLGEHVENIHIVDLAEIDLPASDGGTVGKISITNQVISITLSDEYMTKSRRNGSGVLTGEINVLDGESNDGQPITVTVGDKSYQPVFQDTTPESYLNAYKSTDGKAIPDGDGNPVQKYEIVLEAKDSSVSGISVDDTPGANLTLNSKIEITQSDSDSIIVGTKFDSIADLNTALSSITLAKDEKITFSYDMKADKAAYSDDSKNSPSYQNSFSTSYTTSKNNIKTNQNSSVVSMDVNRPSINKSGSVNGGKAQWTITINLGDKSAADITAITDTFQYGITGTAPVLTLADFTDAGNGQYTYQYSTDIEQSILDSTSQIGVKNDVSFTIDGYTYTSNGVAWTPGRTWISKECLGESDGEISWKVTLKRVPDVTNVTLEDITTNNGSKPGVHTLVPDIYVDGTQVVSDGIADTGTNIITSYSAGKITFSDEYIAAAKDDDIVVTYKTSIQDTDDASHIYINEAKINYIDSSSGEPQNKSQNAYASWENSNAATKNGQQISGKNSIKYTILINLNNVGTLTLGKNITVTDILPDGLSFDKESITIEGKKEMVLNNDGLQYWDGTTTVESAVSGDTVTFTIPVTDTLIEKYNRAVEEQQHLNIWSKYSPCLLLTYTTDVDNQLDFTQADEAVDYINSATIVYDGNTVGTSSTTTSIEPANAVEKTALYDSTTAPYIKYTVKVNPNAIDLSDGALSATDTLGMALSYDLDSIVIVNTATGDELVAGTDYNYAFSYADNSIKFSLPDATPLEITYRARVNLYVSKTGQNGMLTEANSGNDFSLDGYSGGKMSSTYFYNQMAVTPAFLGNATVGTLNIHKIWNNNGVTEALGGCTFKLMECTLTDDGFVMGNTIKSDIVSGEDGIAIINNLQFDHYYAIVETGAADGFAVNTTPFYFVIPGSGSFEIPEGVDARLTANGGSLYIENKPAQYGNLVINKIIKGDVDKTLAEQTIIFAVENVTTKEILEYKLYQFEFDSENDIYSLTLKEQTGEYIVWESVSDIKGYTTDEIRYAVGSADDIKGDETKIEIVKNEDLSVTFIDKYSTPTDPTDPTNPTDPTDPTNPTDPTDPTNPTDPTDSTDPTDPTDPSEPPESDEITGERGGTRNYKMLMLLSGGVLIIAKVDDIIKKRKLKRS